MVYGLLEEWACGLFLLVMAPAGDLFTRGLFVSLSSSSAEWYNPNLSETISVSLILV